MNFWDAYHYSFDYENLEIFECIDFDRARDLRSLKDDISPRFGNKCASMLTRLVKNGCDRTMIVAALTVIGSDYKLPKATELGDRLRKIRRLHKLWKQTLNERSRFYSRRFDEYQQACNILGDFINEATKYNIEEQKLDENAGKQQYLQNIILVKLCDHIKAHCRNIPWVELQTLLESEKFGNIISSQSLKRRYYAAKRRLSQLT